LDTLILQQRDVTYQRDIEPKIGEEEEEEEEEDIAVSKAGKWPKV